MLVAKFSNQTNPINVVNVFLSCLRGLWGFKSIHGNIVLRALPQWNLTAGKIVDALERARHLIVTQQNPKTAEDIGLIKYDGDIAGFRMWSEEPRNHVRVTCDLRQVTVDVAAGTEAQLREIVAQSGVSCWAYMDTSGAVTEGPLDEVVAMEMTAEINEAIARC